MFGFKKKSEDDVVLEALRKGISEAKIDISKKKGDLQKAYNAASGVLKGLEALKKMEGSTFDYEVIENGTYLNITTKIPAKASVDKVTVTVKSNGCISVYGDSYLSHMDVFGKHYSTEHVSSRRHSATRKALAYIAQKATEKGLIP